MRRPSSTRLARLLVLALTVVGGAWAFRGFLGDATSSRAEVRWISESPVDVLTAVSPGIDSVPVAQPSGRDPIRADVLVRILAGDQPARGAELLVLPWTSDVERHASGLTGITRTQRAGVERLAADDTGIVHLKATWDRAFVVAWVDGLAPLGSFVEPRLESEVDLALGPGHALRGRVIDPNGSPIPDAEVSARLDFYRLAQHYGEVLTNGRLLGMLWSATTYSDREGRFLLDGLSTGVHHVTARHPRHAAEDDLVFFPEDEGIELTLTLRAGASLRGIVVDDATGTPIEDALVLSMSYEQDGYLNHDTASSDARGEFRLAVVAGTSLPLKLDVEHPAYASYEALVGPVAEGRIAHHEVRLRPARSLEGAVLDSDRRPVSRAVVRARDVETGGLVQQVFTDADGTYDLNRCDAGRSYEVEAEAAGFLPHSIETRVGDPPLTFVLERTGRLAGRLVPPPGVALEEAYVRLAGERQGADRLGTLFLDVEPDGRFEVDGLWPLRYQVDASAKGCGITRVGPLDLEAGESIEDLEIALEPAVHVTGRVVSAVTGEPLSGAQVAIADADTAGRVLDGFTEPVTTDSLGCFDLSGVVAPSTPTSILVTHDDHAPVIARVPVDSGGRAVHVDVRLPAAASLRVTRLDEAGNPKPGMEVILDVSNGMRHRASVTEHFVEWTISLPAGRTSSSTISDRPGCGRR